MPTGAADWDYYQRWLQALERMVLAAKLVDPAELERRTAELLSDMPAFGTEGGPDSNAAVPDAGTAC